MRASKAFFANASWRSALVIAVALAACSRESAAPSPVPAPSTATATSTSTSTSSATTTSTSTASNPAYLTAPALSAKAIGTTSLVFKLKLEGDLTCAFKPRSRRFLGGTRYKSEIAAYRIARALGIDNVPVALPRSFDVATLRALLAKGPDGAKADELLVDPDGLVRGALLPWQRRDRFDIDLEPNRARWVEWLTSKTPSIPEKDVAIARQISTMLLFDYFTANWDRFSGDNVGIDRATNTVLFVDNDGAFYETPDIARLADQLGLLRRVNRFSRRFVAALRALGRHAIEDAAGEEAPGVPVLSKKLVDAAEERRLKLLGIIDAKIAKDGEASVLWFE